MTEALEAVNPGSVLVSPQEAATASRALGRTLPESYWRNALVGQERRFVKKFFRKAGGPAEEDLLVEVLTLLGVGGPDGVAGEFGSEYLIGEWGYPRLGVVVCMTPSAGPDCVMLDYTDLSASGEPAVVYVDVDAVPNRRRLASSFEDFLAGLFEVDPEQAASDPAAFTEEPMRALSSVEAAG